MVEVTLRGYISAHRRDTADSTPPADSYMPVVPACVVVSALQACFVDSTKKKTRVGLSRPRPWTLKKTRAVLVHGRGDFGGVYLRPQTLWNRSDTTGGVLHGSTIHLCCHTCSPRCFQTLSKKKTRVGLTCDFSLTSTLD